MMFLFRIESIYLLIANKETLYWYREIHCNCYDDAIKALKCILTLFFTFLSFLPWQINEIFSIFLPIKSFYS